MLLTIKNPALIAIAWGPRRATSSVRYGALKSAYPESVTADHGLWLRWVRQGVVDWLMWRWTIVVPASKAIARIASSIEGIDVPAPDRMEIDIEALSAQRTALRAAKRFVEADAIRERIVASGVRVEDQPAGGMRKNPRPA